MAELVFFSGTMDCGKSTLALQIDHNQRARERQGLIFTKLDRAGESVLSSRLGLATSAVEVGDSTCVRDLIPTNEEIVFIAFGRRWNIEMR